MPAASQADADLQRTRSAPPPEAPELAEIAARFGLEAAEIAEVVARHRANADQFEEIGQIDRAQHSRRLAGDFERIAQTIAGRKVEDQASNEWKAKHAVTRGGRAQAAAEAEHRQRLAQGKIKANAFNTTAEDRAALRVVRDRVVGRIGTVHRGRSRAARSGPVRQRGSRRRAAGIRSGQDPGASSSGDPDPDGGPHRPAVRGHGGRISQSRSSLLRRGRSG